MPIKDFTDFILGSLAALFPVIDPIGSVPIFLVLTAGVPESLRRSYAKRIARNVVLMLIGFLLVGGGILRFFGISLEVVRIAGGIVVFHAAWNTMNAESKMSELDNETVNVAIFTTSPIYSLALESLNLGKVVPPLENP